MQIGAQTQALDTGHAARMDRMYRYQRHIYDLTRKYYLFGRDSTIAGLDVPQGGSLLEIGCGTGRNLLLAAHRFPTARLYGADISAEMLATAERAFAARGRSAAFRAADATTLTPATFGRSGFDRIMIPYALSMIPDWEKAIDAALSSLGPAGSLHIVDFGQQEGLPAWFRRALMAWLARFHVTPRADLRAALEQRIASGPYALRFESIGRGYAWRAIVTKTARAGL